MQLVVKKLDGTSLVLDEVPNDGTVRMLKQIIQDRHGVPVGQQKLIFAGRAMEDAETLADNNVQHQTAVMLVQTPGKKPTAAAPATAPAPVGPGIMIYVRLLSGESLQVQGVQPTDTVLDVKEKIQDMEGTETHLQRLIFAGRALEDAETCEEAGMEDDTSLMLVKMMAQTAAAPAAQLPPVPPVAPAAEPPASVAPTAAFAAMALDERPAWAGEQEVEEAKADAAPPAVERTVQLNIKTLAGVTLQVQVPLGATFGHIKSKFLQMQPPAGAGIPAPQIRLIYSGALIDDSKSPADYDCQKDTCLHLVRRPVESILDEPIRKEDLMFNCPFCHVAGAPVDPRPICGKCKGEGILAEPSIELGRTKWGDLQNIQATCFNPACGGGGAPGPASVGFLCKARVEGAVCPSRNPQVRNMCYTYNRDEADLLEVLTKLYGYAHGGGFQTKI